MMRLPLGVVGAAAFAAALGACAAISGLNAYSTGECQTKECDASDHGTSGDGSTNGSADGTIDSEVVPGTDGPENGDDSEAGPADVIESGGGCMEGLLTCENGCLNPSSPSSCGSCSNTCEGDAAVCAAVDAGWFVCVAGNDAGVEAGTEAGPDAASDAASDAAPDAEFDGGVPCPDGGCPTSTGTGFSCPFGSCDGTSSECTTPGGCFCSNDNQCLSAKCVKVTGENDVSCGSHCAGSGGRDGFDCELASPGIPSLATGTYGCPADSGYGSTTLTCDPTHTNCYCNADVKCPSGKCIPSGNNAMCASPAGPCSGTGTADYRGCVAPVGLSTECNGIGYSLSCSIGTCSVDNVDPLVTGVCLCNNDNQCDSGKCVPVSGLGGNNVACGSNCTGSGAADEHSCEPAPSSVPCAGTGGTMCTTTLTPAPVPNSGATACLCVADSDCSSGKCVNANGQCTGACTGSAPADSEDCQTATSVANAWSCSIGNCDNVTSPSAQCAAAGIPCWCTSDAQCPSGARCASWAGCSSGACTGSGTGNAFNCVP